MSDIRAGDVVVCVVAGEIRCPASSWMRHEGRHVKAGAVYRVAATFRERGRRTGIECGCAALEMVGGGAGVSSRFRKIDAADDLFTEQMRNCRPAKQRVPIKARGESV